MKRFVAVVLVSFVAAALAGCALNPFAEDNIYKRKNSDTAAKEMKRSPAGPTQADFQTTDTDKNGVISRQEAETMAGLAAVFDKYNPDRDNTLDWNEFKAAMESVNATSRRN